MVNHICYYDFSAIPPISWFRLTRVILLSQFDTVDDLIGHIGFQNTFYCLLEFLSSKRDRYKRNADSPINMTNAKGTADMMLKIYKLLSEGRLQFCQSKGGNCLAGIPGPPGPPGPRGQKGARGRRGQRGRTGDKGDRGIMGSPGKSGKQGIMGPPGLQGEIGAKGQKGDMGPAGMSGAKGEPGESISAPVVAVSPVRLTVNETGSASLQCSVSGNPEPAMVWKKLDNESVIRESAVSKGILYLKNVKGNDSGSYQCSAENILGKSQAVTQLVVNGRVIQSEIYKIYRFELRLKEEICARPSQLCTQDKKNQA